MLPDLLRDAIFRASNAVWGPWTVWLLLGSGLFLSVRYGFPQVRRFGEALRLLAPAEDRGARGALSQFQAFMTALAASIGTGNIAGVATAVVSGGPGAVFWIWCYGFFATTIKLTEAVLGIRFRTMEGDRVAAGPMQYLRDGLGWRRVAWLYALVAGLAPPAAHASSSMGIFALVDRVTWEPSKAAAVRVQVTGRGHHDPGDPTERRLAEALLAAVLEESFTLDRVRRDRVEHEVRRLHEQLLEHEPTSLTECRTRLVD
jgi:Na+/alanine symporter